MAPLSYSFCITILHSLWQCALLVLLYSAAEKILQQKFTPLQKKNFLFTALLLQAILSTVTFCLYYFAFNYPVLSVTNSITTYISPENFEFITPWLFCVYLMIFLLKLAQAIFTFINFKKEFSSCLVKPAAHLKIFTITKQHQFGIKRNIQLWLSKTVTSPVTFGFLKPVIVLPLALINKISIPQAEALILHELAHIKANDYLLNWFLIGMEIIFFFNPFVLQLCKNIKLEREKNCDVTVTAFQYSPLLYAEALMQIQQSKTLIPQYQMAAAGTSMPLYKRICFFTNPKNQIQHSSKRYILPLLTGLLFIICSCVLFFQTNIITTKPTTTSRAASPVLLQTDNQFPVFVNNIVNSITEEKLKSFTEKVEKQIPLLEQKVKKLQPILKQIEVAAEEIEENFAAPVSILENSITKQIVIREETSGSKNAVIKVYTIIYKDGKWQVLPKWKLAAKEVIADSSDTTDFTPQNIATEEQY